MNKGGGGQPASLAISSSLNPMGPGDASKKGGGEKRKKGKKKKEKDGGQLFLTLHLLLSGRGMPIFGG